MLSETGRSIDLEIDKFRILFGINLNNLRNDYNLTRARKMLESLRNRLGEHEKNLAETEGFNNLARSFLKHLDVLNITNASLNNYVANWEREERRTGNREGE